MTPNSHRGQLQCLQGHTTYNGVYAQVVCLVPGLPLDALSLPLINSHSGQQQQQNYSFAGRWRGSDVPKVDDGSCDDPTPARGVVGQLSLLNPLLDSSDILLRPVSALGLSCPALTPRTLLITAWARPPTEPRGEGT